MRRWKFVRRLTGLSTPFGGVSWEVHEDDATVARRIIRFLEDRRVLYKAFDLEQRTHCIQSVLEIRRFLTTELGTLGNGDLASKLAAIRTACRKFLDTLESSSGQLAPFHHGMFHRGSPEWVFATALGEFRGAVGVLVAELAAKYHLDIDGELATILPGNPDTDSDQESGDEGFWESMP